MPTDIAGFFRGDAPARLDARYRILEFFPPAGGVHLKVLNSPEKTQKVNGGSYISAGEEGRESRSRPSLIAAAVGDPLPGGLSDDRHLMCSDRATADPALYLTPQDGPQQAMPTSHGSKIRVRSPLLP